MLADGARIRKQAVKRDECGDGREEGKQRVEGDARCHQEHAVAAEPVVDAPEDIFPALGRDLAWLLCETPAIPLSSYFLFRRGPTGVSAAPCSGPRSARPAGGVRSGLTLGPVERHEEGREKERPPPGRLDSTDECQATLKPAGMGVALTLSVKSSPGFYKGKATVARRSRAVSGPPGPARRPGRR